LPFIDEKIINGKTTIDFEDNTVFAKINVPKNGKPKNSEFLISEARRSRAKNSQFIVGVSLLP
jgi:hypothetical protein